VKKAVLRPSIRIRVLPVFRVDSNGKLIKGQLR